MSLIKCPECNKDVSNEAISCPYCGYPIKKKLHEDKPIPKVIARRGDPGSIRGVCIFDFIFGIIFFFGGIAGIIAVLYNDMAPLAFFIGLFVILGGVAIFAGIQGFVRFSTNGKNPHPCIEYDKDHDKLVLYKINQVKIVISPDDYVSLKDNLFTDNLLYFTYRDNRGKNRKVNLGYCDNRDEIRTKIEKIINK